MKVCSLDHLVLTVRDLNKTVAFCRDGTCELPPSRYWRRALCSQVRQSKDQSPLCRQHPRREREASTPGSGDLCFIVEDSVEDLARGQYACHQHSYTLAYEPPDIRLLRTRQAWSQLCCLGHLPTGRADLRNTPHCERKDSCRAWGARRTDYPGTMPKDRSNCILALHLHVWFWCSRMFSHLT